MDYWYVVLILPAMLFALWAQFKVNSTYNKYNRVRGSRGLTGGQAARQILDQNGLYDIPVEVVEGRLADHYDPRGRVLRLSRGVYQSDSVSAVGIAAHECGHAVQHAEQYGPLQLRSAVLPVTNIGSSLAIPLLLIGLIFDLYELVIVGIAAYTLVALFQLITLPVEFDASRRAMQTIRGSFLLEDDEARGARKVLTAAALTYVAALIASLAQILRLFLLYGNRGRRR